MFAAGLALFTVASAACGLAWSPARSSSPASCRASPPRCSARRCCRSSASPTPGADRVRALSVYGIVLGLAAVGGQLVGGVLVQADVAGLGWRSCFLINVPIGVAALALAPRLVPESRAERASRLDVAGTVLVTVGLTGVVLPLVEGRQHGWPLWTWRWPRRRARVLLAPSPPTSAGSAAAAARRCSTPRCSASARSAPGC